MVNASESEDTQKHERPVGFNTKSGVSAILGLRCLRAVGREYSLFCRQTCLNTKLALVKR